MKDINFQIIEYLNYCKDICRMSPRTINNKRSILDRFCRETNITSVKELSDQIHQEWLKIELGRQISTSSIGIYNSTLLGFVKYFKNAGFIIPLSLNIIPHFKMIRTERKFYTSVEIKKVLYGADDVDSLIISIMFETGMRINELTFMRVENISGQQINFIGKGNKKREVYISMQTFQKLHSYLEKYQISSGYIWRVQNGIKTLNGEPISSNTIRDNLRQTFERAGFEGFYPHALRHSFATDLQQKGASIEEIKEMMGHSSITTTERYLHGFNGKLRELFKKYR